MSGPLFAYKQKIKRAVILVIKTHEYNTNDIVFDSWIKNNKRGTDSTYLVHLKEDEFIIVQSYKANHGEQSWSSMFGSEVFIIELVAID